ncbi:MAG: undecaprenyldiphospho-muramoylpentapeptide beta-N-acetylglucosaminyltransferase [Clostridia bacterium]
MKNIVLTGGGTAGHIMPNIALLPYLNKEYNVFYIGTNGMEKELVKKTTNIPFYEITSAKLERRLSLKNLLIPFKLLKGIFQARKILKSIKPACVFSKGGFVAVPVVIASKMLKIPVVSHESDYSLGLANKICLKFSSCLCTSFKQTALSTSKGVYTGSPIRQSLFKGSLDKAEKECGFKNKKPVILVFGGSLGAKAINNSLREALPNIIKKYNIIHITGKGNIDEKISKDSVYQIEFTNHIEDFFAYANIVVCRSGSNAIFELLALKKPMLLIPLSKASSRGDQIENAEDFKKHNYAHVLPQENLTSKTLVEKIEELFKNKDSLILSMQNASKTSGCENILKEIKKWSK